MSKETFFSTLSYKMSHFYRRGPNDKTLYIAYPPPKSTNEIPVSIYCALSGALRIFYISNYFYNPMIDVRLIRTKLTWNQRGFFGVLATVSLSIFAHMWSKGSCHGTSWSRHLCDIFGCVIQISARQGLPPCIGGQHPHLSEDPQPVYTLPLLSMHIITKRLERCLD